VDSDGPNKQVLDGVQIPYVNGQFLEERTSPGIPKDTLPLCRELYNNG